MPKSVSVRENSFINVCKSRAISLQCIFVLLALITIRGSGSSRPWVKEIQDSSRIAIEHYTGNYTRLPVSAITVSRQGGRFSFRLHSQEICQNHINVAGWLIEAFLQFPSDDRSLDNSDACLSSSSVFAHWALCVSLRLVVIGPVILTSARIGSPGPGRFPYSHCGWVPLRPSDSDFAQNWKPGTGEIPILSMWLAVIDAQWFWLWPEVEARDRGDSRTLTVVGCHWGPVILTSARVGSPAPGRFPTLFEWSQGR
jgi:hypothetical protein